jgi:hypothetical protein
LHCLSRFPERVPLQTLPGIGNQRTITLHKCRCNSVWCPHCYRQRKLPQLFSRLNDRLDWRSTRHVVLTIDRKKFCDGRSAYLHVTEKKLLNQLIHNLRRTVDIAVRDYVWVLEFHKDGFPHWHLFIDVQKTGPTGKIHFTNILKYWEIGNVEETYFRTRKHWERIVGYFGKHCYFEKAKAHQAKLPNWAMEFTRTIKRSGGGQIQSAWVPENIKKEKKKRTETKKENKILQRELEKKEMHRNGCYVTDQDIDELHQREQYSVIIEKCGKGSTALVMIDGKAVMGFSIPVPYFRLRQENPHGQMITGVGYQIYMDDPAYTAFVRKYMPKLM